MQMSTSIKSYHLNRGYYNYFNHYRSDTQLSPQIRVIRAKDLDAAIKVKKRSNHYYERMKRFVSFAIDYVGSRRLKISKFIVATLSITYCCYQILMISMMYLEYKTKVSVTVSEPDVIHMPGITVCTNTRIVQSKFDEFMNSKGYSVLSEKLIARQIDPKITPADMIAKGPVYHIDQMSPSRNIFIQQFYCNLQHLSTGNEVVDLNRSKNCIKYPVVRSIQPGGKCFTYFHYGLQDPKFINKTEEEPEFEDNDLVVMKVNFTPADRIGIKQTGGRVIIHDNLDVPSTLTKSVPIKPGEFYEIYIKRGTTINKEYPYDTKCKDYDESLEKLKNEKDFMIPLNRIQCIETCMAKSVIEVCKCWPNNIPYVSNFTDYLNQSFWNSLDIDGSLPWCNVQEIKKVGNYSRCFPRKRCADSCPITCRKDNYDFFSYTFKKINKEDFVLSDSELDDIAKIVIKYSSTEYTTNQREPLLSLVETVCYIGGLMGMYIGISFISLYDILVNIMIRAYKIFKSAHKEIKDNI